MSIVVGGKTLENVQVGDMSVAKVRVRKGDNGEYVTVYQQPYAVVQTETNAVNQFKLNSNGYWESQNKNVGNGYSLCKVIFPEAGSYVVHCKKHWLNNEWYILSKINTELSASAELESALSKTETRTKNVIIRAISGQYLTIGSSDSYYGADGSTTITDSDGEVISITSATYLFGCEIEGSPVISGTKVSVTMKGAKPSTTYSVSLSITYKVNIPAKAQYISGTTYTDCVYNSVSAGDYVYIKYVPKNSSSAATDFLEFKVEPTWVATVSNLGASSPSSVTFDVVAGVSGYTPWGETEFNGDKFIKFNTIYRQVLSSSSGQITKFKLSNYQTMSSQHIYPCFVDENANELDYILVGKYQSSSTTTCNSVSTSSAHQTIANGRAKARARGAGYQLMDWRIQRLIQDLLICELKTVNTNDGSWVKYYALGMYWGDNGEGQWIDGISVNGSQYLYSNTPSKYVNSPTSSTSGYSAMSGYSAPNAGGFEIMKLGYDATQSFFNYPSATTDVAYTTYYCDYYYYTSDLGSRPVGTIVDGTWAGFGVYDCRALYDWSHSDYTVRLCYRPIKSS